MRVYLNDMCIYAALVVFLLASLLAMSTPGSAFEIPARDDADFDLYKRSTLPPQCQLSQYYIIFPIKTTVDVPSPLSNSPETFQRQKGPEVSSQRVQKLSSSLQTIDEYNREDDGLTASRYECRFDTTYEPLTVDYWYARLLEDDIPCLMSSYPVDTCNEQIYALGLITFRTLLPTFFSISPFRRPKNRSGAKSYRSMKHRSQRTVGQTISTSGINLSLSKNVIGFSLFLCK